MVGLKSEGLKLEVWIGVLDQFVFSTVDVQTCTLWTGPNLQIWRIEDRKEFQNAPVFHTMSLPVTFHPFIYLTFNHYKCKSLSVADASILKFSSNHLGRQFLAMWIMWPCSLLKFTTIKMLNYPTLSTHIHTILNLFNLGQLHSTLVNLQYSLGCGNLWMIQMLILNKYEWIE